MNKNKTIDIKKREIRVGNSVIFYEAYHFNRRENFYSSVINTYDILSTFKKVINYLSWFVWGYEIKEEDLPVVDIVRVEIKTEIVKTINFKDIPKYEKS